MVYARSYEITGPKLEKNQPIRLKLVSMVIIFLYLNAKGSFLLIVEHIG